MKAEKDFIGVGCGAIIINNNNEILLVKRSKNSRTEPGMWSRPGGQVEFSESASEAVEREVKEETNLVVKIIRSLEFTENLSDDKSPPTAKRPSRLAVSTSGNSMRSFRKNFGLVSLFFSTSIFF